MYNPDVLPRHTLTAANRECDSLQIAPKFHKEDIMGTRNVVSKSLLLLVLLLTGCSSSAREVPVTVEVTMEVPVTVEVTREVQVTSEPATSVTEATIPETEVRTLHSSATGRDYRIYVALPQGYSTQTTYLASYPVVYLLDGNYCFAMTAQIAHYLSHLGRELPELIIVGIGYPTDDYDEVFSLREWDMLPTKRFGGGGAGGFLEFIQEELIPHIDANYRTIPANRTIAGHSYGGLFTLYALFHAPETFNHYLVMSPALWYDDQVAFEYEQEYARNHSELPVELFLSIGELEPESSDGLWMVTNLKEFHSIVEDRNYAGLEMEMAIMESVGHASSLPGAICRGFRMVFR